MILTRNKSGFTMVELLVVLAISSIVLSLMYQVYRSQLRTHTTQQELVEMQQNMRAALYLMERDIRMAGYSPASPIPASPITIAETERVRFSMDLTMDGVTDDDGEIMNYFLDDGTGQLIRNASDGNGDQAILEARNINSLTFVYKDLNGAILDDDTFGNVTAPASLQAIRTVEIILTAQIGTTVMVDPHTMELRSEVKIRNMGLNP